MARMFREGEWDYRIWLGDDMPKKKIATAALKKARAIARKVAKAAAGIAIEKRRLAKKKRAKKR